MRWGKIFVRAVLGLGMVWGLEKSNLAGTQAAYSADQEAPFEIRVSLGSGASKTVLKSWSLSELLSLKSVSSREKDPEGGQLTVWKGVPFSKWFEKVVSELPVEGRARVDLLVLRGAGGEEVLIPRFLITRYPLMLAAFRNGVALKESGGAIQVVVPWSSKPGIQKEGLPLGAYFGFPLREMELTNYESRVGALLLQRRTDPAAIRGEKLFTRNCIVCHQAGKGSAQKGISLLDGGRSLALASLDHPKAPGAPELSAQDRRALTSYYNAFRSEKPEAQRE